jgi:hypothetical protein
MGELTRFQPSSIAISRNSSNAITIATGHGKNDEWSTQKNQYSLQEKMTRPKPKWMSEPAFKNTAKQV